MNLLPKPRGFADYGLFALLMTGLLVFLFWAEASNGVGWTDCALAFAGAVLLVFAIILVRGNEKAAWIARPTWPTTLLASLACFALVFGAIYADAYLLHRADLTFRRLSRDMVVWIVLAASVAWSLIRRSNSARKLP